MKYSAEELNAEIKLAISEGRAIVFKNFFEDNPGWEEVLQRISDGYHDSDWNDKPSGYPSLEVAIGRLMVRGRFYITLRLDSDGYPFEGIKGGYDFLSEAVSPSKLSTSHAIASIVGHEKLTETEVHADPVHTFYWQLQGESTWRFYKERCCAYCSALRYFDAQVTVNSGDLLFMPREMLHTVYVTAPRAAVVFRFEQDDELYTPGALRPEDPKEL